MKYFTEFTGYAGAIDCLTAIGGQLFPGKRRDSTSTVVRGQEVYTFWDSNSKNYQKCRILAEEIGFPHEHFTSGRIAKFILEEVVGIDPKYGQPDPVFIKLARDGFHWHYTYVETGYHPYLLEFDLCAAYATSLAQFASPYFSMSQELKTEETLMNSLRAALEGVPKWMRMILIGQMAAHKMTFATMPNRKTGDFTMKWNTIGAIKYGFAFNRTHQAILRVYRLLENIHKIGSDSVKRIHTDSFALSIDCDASVEAEIFALLDDKGFSYSVKAQGTSHFFDLNSGVIGRKFVGVPFEIREQIKALPQKPRRVQITAEQLERWGIRGVLPDRAELHGQENQPQSLQLELTGVIQNARPESVSRFA